MKIYTKTGDDGTTSLFGGKRVQKNDPRVIGYGTIDELNAHIGYVKSVHRTDTFIDDALEDIQNDLFIIGSHIATPKENQMAQSTLPPFSTEAIAKRENEIDTMEEQLLPLTQFILPGGSQESAAAHIARTVCRRAERILLDIDEIDELFIAYINRLSDWLFVCARYINHTKNQKETPWNPRTN